MMIKLVFPYPPSGLNPNKRLHWAQKVKMKNQQKDLGYCVASRFKDEFIGAKTISLLLVFYAESKRPFDLDNALASCKALIDGISKGLNFNDKDFLPITIDRGEPDKKQPRVEIFLDKKC
jgi:crossover junction endodeoxyribonuclease RusA